MSTARQILKNAGALTAARGVTAILTLATTVYLARVLEPSAYGILTWALAYCAYFRLIPDWGLSVLGAREIARDHGRVPDLAGRILGVRTVLVVVALGLYLAVLFLLGKPRSFTMVVAVYGLSMLGLAASLDWVYQGIERMGVLAVRNVVAAGLILIGVLVFVRRPEDVVLAAGAMAFALIAASAWILVTYRRDFGRFRLRFAPTAWRPLLVIAFPIGAVHGLAAINANMDQLMLGLLRSETEVGWYGAAYRLLLAALIPSQILLQAFLPSLSSASGNLSAMRERGRMFAQSLFAFGLPIGAAGMLFAPDLLGLFGADYAPAALALTILMAHLVLMYVSLALGNPLIAWNQQRLYMYAFVAGAAANVVLNLALVPRYGIEGAALATLASELVVLGGVAFFHHRVVGQLYAAPFLKALAATALAVGGALAAREWIGTSFILAAATLSVVYLVAAPALGVIDLRSLRRLYSASDQ